MLKLKPNCEYCDKDLPPQALDARICSYECTFCVACVEQELLNVCPNCGGGFTPRPVRPALAHRDGVGLAFQPPSEQRILLSKDKTEVRQFCESIQHIAPHER